MLVKGWKFFVVWAAMFGSLTIATTVLREPDKVMFSFMIGATSIPIIAMLLLACFSYIRNIEVMITR